MQKRPRQVLIAHQDSIPHYRVRFYELLEERRPRDWEFRVVFDTCPERHLRFFRVPVAPSEFKFPILDVRSFFLHPQRHDVVWQTFFLAGRHADLLITDTYLKNLTYPATLTWKLFGQKRIFWGHTRHRSIRSEEQPITKRALEWTKQRMIRWADLFFAYTPAERQWLIDHGWPESRVISLNNTIDTLTLRRNYLAIRDQRETIRSELGVADKRVLIYVGRLLQGKRLEFLLDSFCRWQATDPLAMLFVVGGGDLENKLESMAKKALPEGTFRFFGALRDNERSKILVASDVFVIPGNVGLGPLSAMCYDLPVVAFDLPTHNPEIEYLTPENSVILPKETSPEEFAKQLPRIFDQFSDPSRRAKIYPSIAHLTIEAMVDRFIEGIERVFALDRNAGG